MMLRFLPDINTKAVSFGEAVLVPEVHHAMLSWVAKNGNQMSGVVIGDIATNFYCSNVPPTDVMFLNHSQVMLPSKVSGFARIDSRTFKEHLTSVYVRSVTGRDVFVPQVTVNQIFETAVEVESVKVASMEAMLVLHLYASLIPGRKFLELARVQRILNYTGSHDVDLSSWKVPAKVKSRLNLVLNDK